MLTLLRLRNTVIIKCFTHSYIYGQLISNAALILQTTCLNLADILKSKPHRHMKCLWHQQSHAHLIFDRPIPCHGFFNIFQFIEFVWASRKFSVFRTCAITMKVSKPLQYLSSFSWFDWRCFIPKKKRKNIWWAHEIHFLPFLENTRGCMLWTVMTLAYNSRDSSLWAGGAWWEQCCILYYY